MSPLKAMTELIEDMGEDLNLADEEIQELIKRFEKDEIEDVYKLR